MGEGDKRSIFEFEDFYGSGSYQVYIKPISRKRSTREILYKITTTKIEDGKEVRQKEALTETLFNAEQLGNFIAQYEINQFAKTNINIPFRKEFLEEMLKVRKQANKIVEENNRRKKQE